MIELTGIIGSVPISAMAFMGLARVLSEDVNLDLHYGWENGYGVVDGINQADLIEALMEIVKHRHESLEFNWTDSIRKVSPERYREACQSNGEHRYLSFMAAYATDTVLDRNGNIRTTRLDLTSGNQKFIAMIRNAARTVADDKVGQSHVISALFGGCYVADNHSLGWDPAVVRTHAHEHIAPSKQKPMGKPGWIWLASESLPMHPLLPAGKSQVITTGCSREAYYWPIWLGKLRFNEIRDLRLLNASNLAREDGISEIWHSKFDQSGKYGCLLPAVREPIASAIKRPARA